MKKKSLLLFLLLFSTLTFAQNEASIWYFGRNAGLQFDTATGTVTSIIDGEIDTVEGCTSISDENGNLQFYTDGQTVWNRNHQIMANGDYFGGTGLLGDPSSTSSGLIVPKPDDPTQYYIFTVDEPHHDNASVFPNQFTGVYDSGGTVPSVDDGFNNGFNYSLVDMTLNGGLGDVVDTEKNVQLRTYDDTDNLQVRYKCSEKITAVKADDCSSFWVITHFVDKFYAFKVDLNGVNTTPVISTVGPTVPAEGYRRNALGYLKASPDGTKLVVAHFGFATNFGTNAAGGVYLFDFDNNTGIVSNSIELFGPQNNTSPYGVEFSAENRKVYATTGIGAAGNGASQLLQWDLEAMDIPASIQTISTSSTFSAGALQLGIDKRIYRAQVDFSNFNNSGRFLGIINAPEANGTAANFVEQGILVDVNGSFQNLSRIGLPPFIQSLFNSQIDIIQNGISTTELLLCNGGNFTLAAEDISGATYTWSKDGIILPAETTFQLFVDTPGFYEVFIEPNNGECPIEGEAVVAFFEIPVISNQPNNIVVCDTTTTSTFDFTTKDNEILGALDPVIYGVHYFENIDDANNNTNEIIGSYTNTSNPQEIFVRVNNNGNSDCFDSSSFFIEVFIIPIIDSLDDIAICDIDFNANNMDGITSINLETLNTTILGAQDNTQFSISYHPTQLDADDNTNPFPNLYTNTTAYSEEIFVRIENDNNTDCFSTDSFILTVNDAPEANNSIIIQCDEDGIPEGFTTFNINQIFDDIIGGNSDRNINYYLSIADATNNENEIDGDNFNNFFNPQTVYALVTNTVTDCTNIAEITLEVSLTSSNNAFLFQCDDDGTEDGFFNFNLSDANADVLNGLPANLDLVYYETYNDALVEQNPLATNFTNTVPFNQTIFARVENANACFGISEVELTVFELPNVETEFETFYCLNFFPEPITLTGGIIGDSPSNYFYDWSTGETTSEILVNEPGTYTVIVTNTDGCFKNRTVTVLPSNIATFTNIEIIDASQNNIITVFVSGEGDYEYAIDDINGPYQDSNVFEDVNSGLHTIYVRDKKNNCGIVDDLISVIGFPKFFTPNGDTYNETWQVSGISEQFQANTTIFIFDRYGKLLKELDPLSPGWDGTFNGENLPTSDYWFFVNLEDGRTFKNHFTLKR